MTEISLAARDPPNAAEIVSILAKAMGYTGPPRRTRVEAHSPTAELEITTLTTLYRSITDREVRQAVLDVLVAIDVAPDDTFVAKL